MTKPDHMSETDWATWLAHQRLWVPGQGWVYRQDVCEEMISTAKRIAVSRADLEQQWAMPPVDEKRA